MHKLTSACILSCRCLLIPHTAYGGLLMRFTSVVLIAIALMPPAVVRGQSVSLHAAGGPTLGDAGYSLMAGLGISPTPRLTFMANVERSHLPSRRREYPGSVSYFRGGTFTLASAELRLSLFERDRVSPYVLAGFAAGRSRPNVNDVFPTPVVTSVRAPFAGGGVHVPVGQRLMFFADLRLALIVGTESEDLYALAPLRAGLSWRF